MSTRKPREFLPPMSCTLRLQYMALLPFICWAAAPGCSDRPEGQTFELKVIVYEDIKLGDMPDGTMVDVYPTYVVIRRPGPEPTTIVPMDRVRAMDVEGG